MKAVLPGLAALVLLLAASARAGRAVDVPVDVGVGPAAYFFSGPVYRDQPVHFGLKLSVQAVLDQAWIAKNQRVIPRKYRTLSKGLDEVRISPSLLIPDAIILSPRYRHTGIYGVTWRPLGVSVPLTDGFASFRLRAGLLFTYAYLYSDTLADTHFLRPGADLGAELELKFSKHFLVSMGWSSGLYVPQKLGSLGFGPLGESIFHVGQASLQLHFRFPVRQRL